MYDFYYKIASLRAYCEKAGLSMQLIDGEQQSTAFTDGKTIFVPHPQLSWSDDQWAKWEFLCYHEAGHNRAPTDDAFTWLDKQKLPANDYKFMVNIQDDFRQEFIHSGQYAGMDRVMDKGRGLFTLEGIELIQKRGVANSTKGQRIHGCLFVWTDRNRQYFQTSLKGLGDIKYDMLDDEQKKWCDKLEAYDDALMLIRTADEQAALLDEVLEKVFDYTPEEIEDLKSEPEVGSGGEGEGEGDEDAEAGVKDDAESEDEARVTKVSWRDIIPHDHDEEHVSTSNLEIDFDGYSYGKEGCRINPDPKIVDKFEPSSHMLRAPAEIHSASSLANKLRKLLRVKSMKRWQHGTPKGKLSSRSLYKVVKDDDDFDIFRKKSSKIDLNNCVTLLVDMSGSMGGSKWDNAANAAYALFCSLAKLRVNTEIIGFKSTNKDSFYIFKSFTEKVSEGELKRRLQCELPGASNEDAAALLFASDRLIRRREVGKHLIVLSDGQPAGYSWDSMGQAITVAKRIEASPIQLFGIGIEDNSVKHIYKEYTVINNHTQLEDALLKLIKRKFIDG